MKWCVFVSYRRSRSKHGALRSADAVRHAFKHLHVHGHTRTVYVGPRQGYAKAAIIITRNQLKITTPACHDTIRPQRKQRTCTNNAYFVEYHDHWAQIKSRFRKMAWLVQRRGAELRCAGLKNARHLSRRDLPSVAPQNIHVHRALGLQYIMVIAKGIKKKQTVSCVFSGVRECFKSADMSRHTYIHVQQRCFGVELYRRHGPTRALSNIHF